VPIEVLVNLALAIIGEAEVLAVLVDCECAVWSADGCQYQFPRDSWVSPLARCLLWWRGGEVSTRHDC
jgi:hypothetical protein